MLLPGCQILKICFIFTVIFHTVAAYPYPEEDKTFDIKIGFDLTNGENGVPSLRIRDFEDSHEIKPRADRNDDDGDAAEDKDGPPQADRADSASSDSEERDIAMGNEKKESSESKSKSAETKPTVGTVKASSESLDESEEDNKSQLKSTRALSPGEFEPEEKNPKIHKREEPEDDDERRRRRKRALEKFDYLLRKSKKVKGLKKFAAYKRYRH